MDYYTLVTMGMGAHRMNVPGALAEYKLERAELAIALPRNWKLKHEDLKNERWYWPIRLLKTLARLPIASDTWLGFGHTMDNEEDFALKPSASTPTRRTISSSEASSCNMPMAFCRRLSHSGLTLALYQPSIRSVYSE